MSRKLVSCANCGKKHFDGSQNQKKCKYSGNGPTIGGGSNAASAVSDFGGNNEEPEPYPQLDRTKSSFDSSPDVEWLLEDEHYREVMEIEDDDDPELDYDNPYVRDTIDQEIEYALEDVSELTKEWFDNAPGDHWDKEMVLIQGTGLGWRSLTGYKVMPMEDFLKNPVRSIAPNTNDLMQNWENDEGVLTATQAHHDAQGEKYTFTPMSEEELDENEYEY